MAAFPHSLYKLLDFIKLFILFKQGVLNMVLINSLHVSYSIYLANTQ